MITPLEFADFTEDPFPVYADPGDTPGDLLSGAFEDRPAAGEFGRHYYATDQLIDYFDTGTVWQRSFGNIDEIWVTDYGAIGDGVADDSDALEAADLEASLVGTPPYSGRGNVIYFPCVGGIGSGRGAYKITRTIERHKAVSWVGGNGRHAAQHSRSASAAIIGTSIASPDPAVSIEVIGATESLWIHDRNLGFFGNNIGLKIKNSSQYTSEFCWMAANTVADDDNAGLYIENSWGLTFNYWNAAIGTVAAGQFSVRLVAAPGGPIQGVSQTSFLNGIMDIGGAVFENRTTTQTGDSEEVLWDNVFTESQDTQPFITFLGGGSANHDLMNWEIVRCSRADSAGAGTGGSDSQAFILMDSNGGAGRLTFKNGSVRLNNPYAYYVFQCVGGTKPDVIGTTIFNTVGFGSGLVWDPAKAPFNRGISCSGTTPAGPAQWAHSNGMPTLARTGANNTAYAAGQGEDDFYRWAAGADGMVWGDGTSATPDVTLYREAANELKTDNKFLAALGIGVGNSAAAGTPGTVVKKMEVFDASGASLGFVAIYDAIT